jgi:hypothetical protein
VEVESDTLRSFLLDRSHKEVSAFIQGCAGSGSGSGSSSVSGAGLGTGTEHEDRGGDEGEGGGSSPAAGVCVTLDRVVCCVGSGHKRFELCLGSFVGSGSGSGSGSGGKRGRAPIFRLTQEGGEGLAMDRVEKRQRRST